MSGGNIVNRNFVPRPTQTPTSKPFQAAAGPLGTGAAAWVVAWSNAGSTVSPFVVTISSSLTPASSPPAANEALVTSVWSDGPPGTTLESFGVIGYGPPGGAADTLLEAIDAAVLAAAVVYGTDVVLQDTDTSLRQTIALAWIVWHNAGGDALPGGAGGQLQTLAQELG